MANPVRVRDFDGSDDKVVVAYAPLAAAMNAGLTIAFIADIDSDTGTQNAFTRGGGSGTDECYVAHAATTPLARFTGTAVSPASMLWQASDGWCIYAVTKASGSSTPRFHKYVFSTDTWSHEDGDAAAGDPAATTDDLNLGCEVAGFSHWNGRLLVVGVWLENTSDGNLEANLETALSGWRDMGSGAAALWRLDQASASDAVLDLTGNGGDSSTITGTTIADITGELTFDMDVEQPPITFVGAGALAATATDGGSINPALPSGWAADDIVFCLVQTNADNVPTISSGWTEVTEYAQNHAQQSTKLWWRRMQGGDSAPTVTDGGTTALSSSNGMHGRCYGFRGTIASGTPFEDQTAAGSTAGETTPDTAAIDTTGVNRLVVNFLAVDENTAWSSGHPPSGWSDLVADATSATGGDARLCVIGRREATAASVSSAVVGTLGASERWRSCTLALIPPTTAGLPPLVMAPPVPA